MKPKRSAEAPKQEKASAKAQKSHQASAKRPPKKRRRPPSPHERAERALRELKGLAFSLAQKRGVSRGDTATAVERLTLPLSLSLAEGKGGATKEEVHELIEKLDRRVGEMIKAHVAFQPGRVYCFQCDAPDCRHTTPQQPDETFSGYTPTGRPNWETFTNVCLSLLPEQVERLYGDHPEIIALSQHADQLRDNLLPGFGRDSLAYRLLGQVVIGLIPRDFRLKEPDAPRIALTIQIVETLSGKAARRLKANLLGLSHEELIELAADSHERGPAERLRRTLQVTRNKLGDLGRKLAASERRGQPIDLEKKAKALVNGLRGDIERIFRPVERRTRHAQSRHLSGERPTSDALRDAQGAADEQLLKDNQRGTIIVVGRKNRAHVFSPQGKHVTSLRLGPGELGRKLERGRWGKLEIEAANRFRSLLSKS